MALKKELPIHGISNITVSSFWGLVTNWLFLQPVALILGIPSENVFANQLLFGSNGEFIGFDENEPTSRSGGKATAVQRIRKVGLSSLAWCLVVKYLAGKVIKLFSQAHNYKELVMIGDGATDLEVSKSLKHLSASYFLASSFVHTTKW